jgi:hypothetical protein
MIAEGFEVAVLRGLLLGTVDRALGAVVIHDQLPRERPGRHVLHLFRAEASESLVVRLLRDGAVSKRCSVRKLPHLVDTLRVDFPGPRRCPCESHGSRRARSSAF